MKEQVELQLRPSDADSEEVIRTAAAKALAWAVESITAVVPLRRSIDARGKRPIIRLLAEVWREELPPASPTLMESIRPVAAAKKVIVVGAGPAGYFAALRLLALGIQPIVLERGKDVRARRRDLKAIQQEGKVNPHSNYCFGEGGAGTYSDGKLYTRSKKRGSIERVLRLLVEHGATPDILVDTHPHIGSNKLPLVVQSLRESILRLGGEVHFDSHVTNLLLRPKGWDDEVVGVVVNSHTEYRADAVILATGHSARDVFTMLNDLNIRLEAKPFALGVRVEHPQGLIDEIQYRQSPREDALPASAYSLVSQVRKRGVFSFCMCPGGLVVPAATAPGEIVVNGMSMSRRDSPYANSGVVVAVELQDLAPYSRQGVFAALALQRQVESAMFQAGNGSQAAPGQRLTDFVKGNLSTTLPKTSYIPGLFPARLDQLLPAFIAERLQAGLEDFGKQMKGYYTEQAVVIGTESRTSSPIRIPRNPETGMHPDVAGLFPCGEGAGYAGGIVSAAMDGEWIAEQVANLLL